MAFWDTVMASPGGTQYGKRLVPVIVDDIAAHDPERVCFAFPRSKDLADGLHNVNFRTFANAINKTAQFIQREIGRSSMFETVMYMGYPDIRHFIALVALMKTGHKILYSSHDNSVAGHNNLIQRTDCTILLHTRGFLVSGILENCRMETLCMPEMEYLLDDSITCDEYPYIKSWDEAKHHPCLIIQTSGPNGFPRPIVWTQSSLTMSDSHYMVSSLDGRPCLCKSLMNATRRAFSGYPLFQGSGIASGIQKVLFHNFLVVLGSPEMTTIDMFEQVLEYGDIDGADCLPITLEEIATRPDILAKLGKLNYITYGWGLLSKWAGDIVSQHVPLYAIATDMETNNMVQHTPDREDWEYICINPTCNGIEMRPAGDLYELVFVKDADNVALQGVFEIYPQLEEYATPELYSKHATKKHHWRYAGRKDDILVFNNGCSLNPAIHEHLIASHVAVDKCILVGTGRDRPVAILQMRPEFYTEQEKDKKEILEFVWLKIKEANNLADSVGQLAKDCIMFAKKEKPFVTTMTGTVQRMATMDIYESEIQELYNSLR